VRSGLPLPFLSLGVALVTGALLTGVALSGPALPGADGRGVVTPPPHSNPVVTPEAGSPQESVAATTVAPSGAVSAVAPAVLPTDVSSEVPNAENPRNDLGA
jgi:hypothetical protein